MLSAVSLARLSEVHPELARRVKLLAAALDAENISIQVSAGLRTVAQQEALYAVGRTAPGKRITNARGCQSNHVIGCAVDVEPEDDITGLPDWNASHPCWQRIVALAPTYGLRDGKSWNDLPHLELDEVPTEPTVEIQQTYKEAGIETVWKELAIPEQA